MIRDVLFGPVTIVARCQDVVLIETARGVQVWETTKSLTASEGQEELDAALAAARQVGRYRVRYYDAKMSRKGKGVQSRTFDSLEVAEDFARANQLYSKPCKVEVIEP